MAVSLSWTPSQRQAIEARGQNLLVNAGAGAGKTAVLVERVLRLVTDPDRPVSIENMLIVTFTRAAAGEMRHRLAEKLREALTAALDGDASADRVRLLQGQITVLPRAPISTLDSFCLRVLRDSSEAVGLPPDFDLMDEEEAALVRSEMIDEALEEVLNDREQGPALVQVLEQISPAMGLTLVADTVRRLHQFLDSLADPQDFVRGALEELEEASDSSRPLDETALGRRVRRAVVEPVAEAVAACDRLLAACPSSSLTLGWTKRYREELAERRAALQEFLANAPAGALLPDFGALLKAPRRAGLGKNPGMGDVELHAQGARLKEQLEHLAERLGKWGTQTSLEGLRAEAASTLPFARLFLQRLGLDTIERLLEHHLALRRLTFAQVQRLTLRMLLDDAGAPTDIARRLQGDYEHVLVDEFQDVNELQARLLRAVARPGGKRGTPDANLFVVGDVKQSIYGFRQADPLQFQGLYATYRDYSPKKAAQPGARIDLPENFRSTPPLLRELNAIFLELFSPRIGQVLYDEHHAFVPGRSEPEAVTAPCLNVHILEGEESDEEDAEVLDADEREAAAVARLIAESGFAPGETAVLVRSGRGYATKLVEAFQRAGLPFHTQESIGFLAQQEVMDVLALLRTIDNPYREVELIGCLRGPAAEWNEDEVAMLRLRDRGGRLFDNLRAAADDEQDPIRGKAAAFLMRLAAWQHAVRRESMGVFFGRLYEELLLRERVATLPHGDQRTHNLEYLHRRAVQFDSFRRKGLAQFLGFLDDLMERGEDLGTPAAVAANADVVRIMTMHKSKGLQFPLVVLPFLSKRFNLADARAQVLWDARAGFGVGYLPGRRYGSSRLSVTREMLVDTIEDRSRSEEMRLLYVAMTRAKERLVLTGTMKKSAEKVEKVILETGLGRDDAVARSQSFLAWVLMGLAARPEMGELAASGLATNRAGTWAVHLEPAPTIVPTAIDDRADRDAVARLEAMLPELGRTFERVARLDDLAAPVAVRAKVSATEAKRAFEALHSPDNPPAAPRGRTRRRTKDLPDWWPTALTPEQESGGAHRGTLTHRLCALVDLEALAAGATVAEELERLVARRFFSEADAARIPISDVQRFFALPGLGARVLAARATARREVPFTIRLSPTELGEPTVADAGWIVFQGMVDLLFEEPDPDAGGRRLVLVDFKTDRWDGTTTGMESLERAYTPQIGLYRLGIERALGRPVEEAWLHFLSGNVSLHVTEGGRPEDWRPWLAAACLLPSADGANADPQGRR